jgi:predicted permease
MDTLIKDILFGVRSLIAKPTYTLIALLTLILGLSITITMFSLVNSILFKPLPLPQSEQLVQLYTQTKLRTTSSANFGALDRLWEIQANTPFQALSFYAYDQGVLSVNESHVPLTMLISSSNYLELLGVPPLLGRWYNAEDVGKNSVVISYDTWVTQYSKRPDIIGLAATINKLSYTVIGVMPAGFSVGNIQNVNLWTPIDSLGRPGSIYGRLKEGLSIDKALAQSGAINRLLKELSSQSEDPLKIGYTSLKELSVGSIKPALQLLSLAVSAVFMITLLNVLNLSFAQYANRVHELAVRASMGATRMRLIRQLLTESFILTIVGGLVGVLISAWVLELIKVLGVAQVPRVNEIGVDRTTIIITLILIVVSACFTALLPAFTLVKPKKLNQVLQDAGSKSTGSRGTQRVRKLLVAAEVSAAVVLLIGSGLLLRSYSKLMEVNPGFSAERVVTGHIWLPDSISSKTQQLDHFQQVIDSVRANQYVEGVAGTSTLPMGVTGIDYDVTYSFGDDTTIGGEPMRGATRAITDDYFRVLNIPLLEGRHFDERDNVSSSQVVIINRTLAKTLWKEGSPVGRTLILPDWLGGPRTIIAVVGDVKHRGLKAEVKAEFYTPFSQQIYPGMSIITKVASGKESVVLKHMTKVATSLDTAAPLVSAAKLSALTEQSVSEEKLILRLISVFSILAIILASIGVYGISDNQVSQRINEIGVRMALGAQPKEIRSWVLVYSIKPVVYGVLIGIAVALAMVRVLNSMLYEVSSVDPITYIVVPIILILVGLLATWLPANRATRIHPQQALHYE